MTAQPDDHTQVSREPSDAIALETARKIEAIFAAEHKGGDVQRRARIQCAVIDAMRSAAPQAGCAKEVRARLDQALSGHTEFSRDTNLSGQYLTDQIWHIVEPLLAPPLPVAEREWQPIETAPSPDEHKTCWFAHHKSFGICEAKWSSQPRGLLYMRPFREYTEQERANGYGHTEGFYLWARESFKELKRPDAIVEEAIDAWMPLPAPPLLAEQGEKHGP
jgi:hypothetical protein